MVTARCSLAGVASAWACSPMAMRCNSALTLNTPEGISNAMRPDNKANPWLPGANEVERAMTGVEDAALGVASVGVASVDGGLPVSRISKAIALLRAFDPFA